MSSNLIFKLGFVDFLACFLFCKKKCHRHIVMLKIQIFGYNESLPNLSVIKKAEFFFVS